MSGWSDDLKFAQTTGRCVEVKLFNGTEYSTGVESVDEENEEVSLYNPQYMGDESTRVRIRLDDISSVSVSDVKWS